MEYVTLNNGVKMPKLGYGVFQMNDAAECETCVAEAIASGYRLIDTAAAYYNEEAVGRGIRKSGIKREDIFLTTKLWIQDASYEAAKRGFEDSLAKLQTDYLDLYLVHHPFGDYYGAWRALTELYKEGRIRAIGVCNFDRARLTDFLYHVDVRPAVNQIEVHPFHQQKEMKVMADQEGIQLEAWAPFAEGMNNIFQQENLVKIGKKYGKSPAQVILRWNMERGIVAIPKSVHKNRMEENFAVWDFKLDTEDMADIARLDGQHSLADLNNPELVHALHKLKVHD